MFKNKDKVICVNNMRVATLQRRNKSWLTKYKTYEVLEVINIHLLYLKNDNGAKRTYNDKRFISQADYRKQKLEKICSKLEIK